MMKLSKTSTNMQSAETLPGTINVARRHRRMRKIMNKAEAGEESLQGTK
jgi:hypothetical protein